MSRFNPWLIGVLLAGALGAWGCSQQRTGVSAKIAELETRYAKLEEDYRTLQAANDQQRKKLTQVEAQRVALEREKTTLIGDLAKATTERNNLRKQVAERTGERDAVQNHLAQFSKELQNLAGRVESVVNNPGDGPSILPASRRND
jgi:chromosome segregation ATPase